MTYLICYDIEDDRWRQKVHDRLWEYGLLKLQFSVFAGVLKDHLMERLRPLLDEALEKSGGVNDSIIILPVPSSGFNKMLILGKEVFGKDELTGTKDTMFI